MYYSVIIAFVVLALVNCLLLIKKKVKKRCFNLSRTSSNPQSIQNHKTACTIITIKPICFNSHVQCYYVLQFVIIFQVKKTCVVMGASFSLLKSLRIETSQCDIENSIGVRERIIIL
jgi:hypothetical protein